MTMLLADGETYRATPSSSNNLKLREILLTDR